MRRIIVSEFVTLDGVMQGPGPEEGFDRAGWTMPYADDEAEKSNLDLVLSVDALLLGGVTYKVFAGAWPNIDIGAFSDQMNSMKKYVVSATLTDDDLVWSNTTQIKDNVVDELKKLKEEDGKDILVNGSATLVQTLVQNDLVDEYRLMVYPVILGAGKHLFQEGLDVKNLKLADSKTFSSGIVQLTYALDKDAKASSSE